jgi:hypothetical protein
MTVVEEEGSMLKIRETSPAYWVQVAQQEALMDQMTELIATTKVLDQYCEELGSLLAGHPLPEIQGLLDRTQARYRATIQQLTSVYSELTRLDAENDHAG